MKVRDVIYLLIYFCARLLNTSESSLQAGHTQSKRWNVNVCVKNAQMRPALDGREQIFVLAFSSAFFF